MRLTTALPLVLVLSAGLMGCPLGHQSGPARAQEAATELNVNTRFGRMELASEKVAPAEREAFLKRRKAWGSSIRVADYEMAGIQMRGSDDAELYVKVAWYRIDQNDLRVTLLKQKWHEFKGDWRLVDESRAEGDAGLLGEAAPHQERSGSAPPPDGPGAAAAASADDAAREEPSQARRPAHFPTIRLGEGAPTAPATIPPVDPNDESTR